MAWVRTVAIYRLLQNLPLGPDDLRLLADAYERTLITLSVKDRNDPLADFIAKKIIEIGQTGLKDPARISARAIEELGLPEN